MVGLVGQPNAGAYSATKGGQIAMSKGMAIDFAPDGIRVNVICPGWIQTPLVEDWFSQQEDEAAARQYIYSHQVFSEHLFTVLLLFALLSTLFVVRRHLLIALLTGSLIALACLTRGQGLVLLVWFPSAVLILTAKWRTTFAATSLMLLGWLIVLTPWWVRNFQVFDRFVLTSNNGGKNNIRPIWIFFVFAITFY